MVWNELIAIYLFLAGLGAGAFVLAALTRWANRPCPVTKKAGFIIAPVVVAVGTLLLMVDVEAGLHNPMRFFLLVTNLGSVMAWGVIILSLFLVVAFVDAVILFVKKETPFAIDVIGMVLAFGVAVYTGVLLGAASTAFPLWHPIVLPCLFLVSAASTGFAAVALVSRIKAPEEFSALTFLPKASLTLPAVELVLVISLLAVTASTGGSAAQAAAASVGALLSGSYALVFWAFIVIGLVFPLAVEVFFVKKHDHPRAQVLGIAGEVGVLAGGFLLRYLMIMAAVAVGAA